MAALPSNHPDREALKARTKAFALRIMKLADSLPRGKPSARTIADQIVRSGASVAANYRAAQRGRSKAEFIAKVGICLEEADETELWLEMLVESGSVPASRLAGLLQEAAELIAIFYTIIRTSRSNA
jgi:four helix bundle protein